MDHKAIQCKGSGGPYRENYEKRTQGQEYRGQAKQGDARLE